MTGRQNATGFDLGFAARLQSVGRETGTLVCSESLLQLWKEAAEPLNVEEACGKFTRH